MAILNSILSGLVQSALLGAAVLCGVIAVQKMHRLFKVRKMFRDLQSQGIPIMTHSLVFGHLLIITKLMKHMPQDVHPDYIAQLILENWHTLFPDCTTCPGIFYVDLWPMGPPTIFTIDPEISSQSISSTILPRAHNAVLYLAPLTQNLDLVSSEGRQWRVWRSRFNPGFSSKNITAMLPSILEEVVIFREILLTKAGDRCTWGPVFQLETLTTNLTFDVIGRAALGIRLNEQTQGPGPFRRALCDQLTHCLFDYNILTLGKILSPIRQWKMARNTRTMRKFLLPHVAGKLQSTSSASTDISSDRATIVDFAVKEFNREVTLQGEQKFKMLDNELINTVIAQLKLFLFAGHDTTATSICWVLHCLAKHPAAADLVRAEHDAVLGADTHEAISRLRVSPHLLNQLPYTLACIKEALRLWPSVGPIRDGSSNFSFAVPGTSVPYPSEGFMIWDGIRAVMRWEHLWLRPLEFIPERWLASPGDPLYPKKNAWHPFGLGSRNCIGQELALVEIKAVLALVVRDFDIDCAWEEWDSLCANKAPKDMVNGHRCYQVGLGTPHTKAGMPVHVKLRSSPDPA